MCAERRAPDHVKIHRCHSHIDGERENGLGVRRPALLQTGRCKVWWLHVLGEAASEKDFPPGVSTPTRAGSSQARECHSDIDAEGENGTRRAQACARAELLLQSRSPGDCRSKQSVLAFVVAHAATRCCGLERGVTARVRMDLAVYRPPLWRIMIA
jgi:hypothetical protein